MTPLALAALLAWIGLVAFRGRFWLSDPELAATRPEDPMPVAVIVPARDEAALICPSLGSLLAQDYAGELEIVLVDDGSADDTAAIARRLPDPRARLAVIEASPRPPGWAGKLWAVHQGVSATDAPLVLLTDADIEHDPRHISTLVAQLERGEADLVSEMVALNCDSPAERALIPAFVYFFQMLYPFAWVNDDRRATAAAAGGTVLIRRRALERMGGIESIRSALIDDVALGRAVKRGGRIWLGHSRLARSIRRYPEFADIWRMIARSAYVELRQSPLRLLAAVAQLALLFLVPPIAALFGSGEGRGLGIAAWLLMAASFLPTLWRYRLAPARAVLLPAIAAFYMAATIRSAFDHHRGRGVVWKQRIYEATGA